MLTQTARTGAMIALTLATAACSTVNAPTSPADLPQVRPDYVVGYLQPGELPDSKALLPPPPAAGSAALAADEEVYRATRALRDTPRWAIAVSDANLRFPHAAQFFACALAMPISAEATPHLNMLLRRVRADASRAVDKAKDYYKRPRPYMVHGEANCTPREQLRPDSYPSGHTSIGWAWALALAEVAPERADAILARGLAYGESRLVCGVHWKSDVDAGRVMGAATVARLHANPVFAAQVAGARKEFEAARAAGVKPSADCATETKALGR